MRTVVNLKAAELAGDAFQAKIWLDRHDEAWNAYLDLASLYPATISTLTSATPGKPGAAKTPSPPSPASAPPP